MPRILIVDDEPAILGVLGALLRMEGYEVLAVSQSEKALNLLRSDEKLDMMITDMRMRPVDGMTLLKTAHEVRPELPVLLVTAYVSEQSHAEAMKLGARGYMSKPFDTDKLIKLVRDSVTGTPAG